MGLFKGAKKMVAAPVDTYFAVFWGSDFIKQRKRGCPIYLHPFLAG